MLPEGCHELGTSRAAPGSGVMLTRRRLSPPHQTPGPPGGGQSAAMAQAHHAGWVAATNADALMLRPQLQQRGNSALRACGDGFLRMSTRAARSAWGRMRGRASCSLHRPRLLLFRRAHTHRPPSLRLPGRGIVARRVCGERTHTIATVASVRSPRRPSPPSPRPPRPSRGLPCPTRFIDCMHRSERHNAGLPGLRVDVAGEPALREPNGHGHGLLSRPTQRGSSGSSQAAARGV